MIRSSSWGLFWFLLWAENAGEPRAQASAAVAMIPSERVFTRRDADANRSAVVVFSVLIILIVGRRLRYSKVQRRVQIL